MANKEENPIDVSAAVKEFVEQRNATLPPEAQLTAWSDSSFYLEGRINMMLKNMALGAILVFIILGVFLHLKVAAWVIIGLPVAFLGAFMMMPVPFVDVTINVMSLFAFILVLGVVVDDAIIIAESAYTETEEHGYTLANIVRGAQRVAVPATFGVLTTMVAFLPMLLQSGATSSVAAAIAWIVILCLAFSLIESKLILPSHLAIMRSSHGTRRGFSDWVDGQLRRFIEKGYKPFLTRAIEYRWTTLSAFIAIAVVILGLVGGGFIRLSFFPEFGGDFLKAEVEIQEGAPDALIVDIVKQMNDSLREVDDELKAEYGFEEDVVQNVFAYVQNGRSGRFQVELSKIETRSVDIDMKEIELRWRDKIGEIAGTTELRFSSGRRMGGGPPVAFRLSGRSIPQVEAAADELAAHLKTYAGLFEVESSANDGPEELRLEIRPEAESMGVTLSDLARQVRQAFYGAQAQRIQRGDSDVRVMVRYPRSERKSIGDLENMWIRLPDRRELPFDAVATYRLERGYSAINRIDGRRAVTVSANADLNAVEPGAGGWQHRGDIPARASQPLSRRFIRHGSVAPGAAVLGLGDDLGFHGRAGRHLRVDGHTAQVLPAAAGHHGGHSVRADRRRHRPLDHRHCGERDLAARFLCLGRRGGERQPDTRALRQPARGGGGGSVAGRHRVRRGALPAHPADVLDDLLRPCAHRAGTLDASADRHSHGGFVGIRYRFRNRDHADTDPVPLLHPGQSAPVLHGPAEAYGGSGGVTRYVGGDCAGGDCARIGAPLIVTLSSSLCW